MVLLRRLLIGLAGLVLVLYVAFVVGLYLLQRNFQYFPEGDGVTPLEKTSLARAEIVSIPSVDGVELGGWYEPAQSDKATILYLKGNWGSFTDEYERYAAWVADGYGFLAFDYRGFPLTPGEITQDNILADSLAAFDWLAARTPGPIVIWGRSLGTGPATYLAGQREAGALLLETPFLSAVTVAAERYPFAPVAWLMHDQFPSNDWIRSVAEPVFLAHGTADQTIAVSNGERLYDLVPNPYGLWIEQGADHNDLWSRGIWTRAKTFFAAVLR